MVKPTRSGPTIVVALSLTCLLLLVLLIASWFGSLQLAGDILAKEQQLNQCQQLRYYDEFYIKPKTKPQINETNTTNLYPTGPAVR